MNITRAALSSALSFTTGYFNTNDLSPAYVAVSDAIHEQNNVHDINQELVDNLTQQWKAVGLIFFGMALLDVTGQSHAKTMKLTKATEIRVNP